MIHPQLLLLALVEMTVIVQTCSFLEMLSRFCGAAKEPCRWILTMNYLREFC